ncbi:DUF4148 domain-containing protein [Pelomonas sp. CA6]|uniref:DUF4148 domain-containing protein n=1 Tax=Pelomonas sp. CA6 TaxID=2907999 RepID=UPI001F4BE4B2|nr:DUF4148 domain-containing protein [Pelomonas sp. CA6]MCH7344405.1 DUF4148 domain-containing protein [Pelomonas sp. CA6]
MNTRTLSRLAVVSATLLWAGLAAAQTTPLTREQVLAELQQARASGEMAAMSAEQAGVGALAAARRDNAQSAVATPSRPAVKPADAKADAAKPKTRAEVVAELERARASGELDQLYQEGGPGTQGLQRSHVPAQQAVAGK